MRLLPRDTRFFDLLELQAAHVVKAAGLLSRAIRTKVPLAEIEAVSREIDAIEHDGDAVVHELMGKLNRTILTPLDHEDIHRLCIRLDDVLDYVDGVAKRFVTFRISEPTHYAVEFARILECSTTEVELGIRLLRDLGRREDIVRQCARINQLENEADDVLREALNRLFEAEAPDPIHVIKWKDIYEHMEIATDKCEDVADLIQGVLVKSG